MKQNRDGIPVRPNTNNRGRWCPGNKEKAGEEALAREGIMGLKKKGSKDEHETRGTNEKEMIKGNYEEGRSSSSNGPMLTRTTSDEQEPRAAAPSTPPHKLPKWWRQERGIEEISDEDGQGEEGEKESCNNRASAKETGRAAEPKPTNEKKVVEMQDGRFPAISDSENS